MIFCKLKALDRYQGLSHNLDTALHFLMEADLNMLAMGRNVIDGDAGPRVFGRSVEPYRSLCRRKCRTRGAPR